MMGPANWMEESTGSRPGFFLDFTGHEELWRELNRICEDMNADVLCLLEALTTHKLIAKEKL